MSMLAFNNLLHTSNVSHNLMFVKQLYLDNNVLFEFLSNCVFIKDALSKETLAKVKAKGWLYSMEGQIQTLVS